jgi:cytochrome c biogenesis protein CcmG, thiol:disulfide interchange protein DsbE
MGADDSGRTAIDWGVYGVPETYVIDGEGQGSSSGSPDP